MMKIEQKLKNSPINYFSDLFVVMMVVAWIVVILVMTVAAIYATVSLSDTTIWSSVGALVSVPLTAGGTLWLVKCSVQHAIAYSRGTTAKQDFPRVNADGEYDGSEQEWSDNSGEQTNQS